MDGQTGTRVLNGMVAEAPAYPLYSEAPLTEHAISEEEYTGSSVNYYRVPVNNPTTKGVEPYIAECNDIIEALGMNYSEGNVFKAVWRLCAARKLGLKKRGYTDGIYDAEKIVFFGERMIVQQKK